MTRRGATLVELMLAALVGAVVMGGLLQGFISLHSSFTFASTGTLARTDADQAATAIGNRIRQGVQCRTKTGCTGTNGSVFSDAAPKSVGIFLSPKGEYARYYIQGGNLMVDRNGDVDVLVEGADATFRYFAANDYNTDSVAEITPTSTTLRRIIAVRIDGHVQRGQNRATFSSVVRLRGGPNRVPASGF